MGEPISILKYGCINIGYILLVLRKKNGCGMSCEGEKQPKEKKRKEMEITTDRLSRVWSVAAKKWNIPRKKVPIYTDRH